MKWTYYIDQSADGYEATLYLLFNDDQNISISLGTFATLDAAKLACERDREALTAAEEAGNIYIVDASQMGIERYEQFKQFVKTGANK